VSIWIRIRFMVHGIVSVVMASCRSDGKAGKDAKKKKKRNCVAPTTKGLGFGLLMRLKDFGSDYVGVEQLFDTMCRREDTE